MWLEFINLVRAFDRTGWPHSSFCATGTKLLTGSETTTMLSADSSGFNAGITDRTALSLLAYLSQTTHHDTEASRGKPSMLPCTTAIFTSDEPNGFAVWCQLSSPRRPCIRFLFISSQVVILRYAALRCRHCVPRYPSPSFTPNLTVTHLASGNSSFHFTYWFLL